MSGTVTHGDPSNLATAAVCLALLVLISTSGFDALGGTPLQNVADVYLLQEGIRSNLPALSVQYGGVAPGRRNATLSFWLPNDRDLLEQLPRISWSRRATGQCSMLLFVDLDAGGRKGRDTEPGNKGPFIHSLWTHCRRGTQPNSKGLQQLQECREIKAYLPPGNMAPLPNRYLWLLFAHACDARLRLPRDFRWGTTLSFRQLLADNAGCALLPVARSLMLVGGPSSATTKAQRRRAQRRRAQRRRPEAATPVPATATAATATAEPSATTRTLHRHATRKSVLGPRLSANADRTGLTASLCCLTC